MMTCSENIISKIPSSLKDRVHSCYYENRKMFFTAGGGLITPELWYHPVNYRITFKGKIEESDVFIDLTKINYPEDISHNRHLIGSIWRNLKQPFLDLVKNIIGQGDLWKSALLTLHKFEGGIGSREYTGDATEIQIYCAIFDKDNCPKERYQEYLYLNEIDITAEELKTIKKIPNFPYVSKLGKLSDISLTLDEMKAIKEKLCQEVEANTFLDLEKRFSGMNCLEFKKFIDDLKNKTFHTTILGSSIEKDCYPKPTTLLLTDLEFIMLKRYKIENYELKERDLTKIPKNILEQIDTFLFFESYKCIDECKSQDRNNLEGLSRQFEHRLRNWY